MGWYHRPRFQALEEGGYKVSVTTALCTNGCDHEYELEVVCATRREGTKIGPGFARIRRGAYEVSLLQNFITAVTEDRIKGTRREDMESGA